MNSDNNQENKNLPMEVPNLYSLIEEKLNQQIKLAGIVNELYKMIDEFIKREHYEDILECITYSSNEITCKLKLNDRLHFIIMDEISDNSINIEISKILLKKNMKNIFVKLDRFGIDERYHLIITFYNKYP